MTVFTMEAGEPTASGGDASSRWPGRTGAPPLPSVTARTATAIAKRRSPEWKQPRSEQALIEWAATLDKELMPLIPGKGEPQWSYLMHLTFAWKQTPPPGTHPDAQPSHRGIPKRHAMSAGLRLVRWTSAWRTSSDSRCLFRLLLWSVEEHKSGNVHAHALSVTTPAVSATHCKRCLDRVSGLRPLWRQLKESWYTHNGIARIEPYKPALRFGAERYVLKYVLKETCLDWGIEIA